MCAVRVVPSANLSRKQARSANQRVECQKSNVENTHPTPGARADTFDTDALRSRARGARADTLVAKSVGPGTVSGVAPSGGSDPRTSGPPGGWGLWQSVPGRVGTASHSLAPVTGSGWGFRLHLWPRRDKRARGWEWDRELRQYIPYSPHLPHRLGGRSAGKSRQRRIPA